MTVEQLKGAMGAAKKKAEAEGATDADKQAYEDAKKAYEDAKAASSSNQSEIDKLKEQVSTLTADRDKLKSDLDAANTRIKEISGSFDSERKAFESEREAFGKEREAHQTTLKGALDLELGRLSEAQRKAIADKFGDDHAGAWAQVQFLRSAGFVADGEPPATSQRTSGGGVGGSAQPITLAEIQAKEQRGAYNT